jgi:hypothetical protein
MSVKVFGFGAFAISVSGLLEGPTQWHIKGNAKIKIAWFVPTIKIPVDTTWGEERQTELPSIKILPLIKKEFEAITNWEVVVHANSNLAVSFRKEEEATGTSSVYNGALVLHPAGELRINQRKIPLNLELDKLGNQRISDVNKLSVTVSIGDGNAFSTPYLKEKFATGEFRSLGESSKLSSPGFDLYDSGIEVKPKGGKLKTSKAVKRIIRYETTIVDNKYRRVHAPFYAKSEYLTSDLYASLSAHFLKGSAVTKSILSENNRSQLKPNDAAIHISPHFYSVAFDSNNKPVHSEAMSFSSQANAEDYLREETRQNPKRASKMHVIPNTEINIAA